MLDLPSSAERHSILELHLERRRPGLKLPLDTVVSRSEGFSGAELEQTVIEAMHLARCIASITVCSSSAPEKPSLRLTTVSRGSFNPGRLRSRCSSRMLWRSALLGRSSMLDLPSSAERHSILELHLERRRPGLKLPLDTVVSRSEGFSGAELEQTVIEAMHLAFADNRELTEPDLIGAASQLIPLSRTASEQLERLKQWADGGRARPASVAAGNEA